jgi:outer membrane protein OmpA-like peptidoglycan-associated protein
MKTVVIAIITALAVVAGAALFMLDPFDDEGAAAAPAPAYAIVAAQTANASNISGTGLLASQIDRINRSGGQLSVILASGRPEALCSGIEIQPLPGSSKERLAGRLEEEGGELSSLLAIGAAVPDSPQIDYPESIKAAASLLNSQQNKDSGRDRQLVVIGSGIDTANERLAMTQGILSADYKAAIDELASKGVLPDLEGVHVTWLGLAQLTAEPQMRVPYDFVPLMKDMWGYFLEQSGAASVSFQDVIVPKEGNTAEGGFPYVTPMLFEAANRDDYRILDRVKLPESVLKFKGDLAEFATGPDNPDPALVLEPLAQRLVASGQKVVVLGTTARVAAWADDAHRSLSLARAQRVRDELVSMGVDAGNILVAGAGFKGVGVRVGGELVDFYHDDQSANGVQIEDLAKDNRAVHVIPFEDAADVLERFGE